MKVSILILNWNTKDWLLKLVNSLREYEPTIDHEIIVVDQGSTDGSHEIIDMMVRQHHRDVIRIYNEQNVGACNGRNQGVATATGDFVLFCDSDIEFCEPGWLETMIETYESNPDCGIVGPYTNYANGKQCHPRDGNYPLVRLYGSQQLISFCMLTPIEIARAFPWNPVLPMFTEADWVRRVISQGWMSYIAPTYVRHHGHKSIVSNQVDFGKTMSRAYMLFQDIWKDRNPHLNWCSSAAIWLDTGLGNVIMSLPFLQALRTFAPHLRIDIHAPRGSDLLKLYPHLYDNLNIPEGHKYNLCFRMFATSEPTCEAQWILHCNPSKWIQSETEETMNLLRKVGYNGGTPKIQPPSISPRRLDNQTIFFHTGSYHDSAKEWPFNWFLKVAEHFKRQHYQVILLGGSEENEKGRMFRKLGTIANGECKDLTGLPIRSTLEYLASGDLLITNDSGIMHLGGIVNIPTLAIFGYTNPIKNPPINGTILQSSRSCVPCYGEGGPCQTRECLLEDITVDMVIEKAQEILCQKDDGNTKL